MNPEKLEELQRWLSSHQTTKNLSIKSNKFHRDFSDCVLLAQLIKELYPKLVDLHNYPPRNAINLKLTNWEIFNRKVLRKLNSPQGTATLLSLAKGENGIIEILLYEIMISYKASKNKQKSLLKNEEICKDLENDIMIINTNKQVGDAIIQVPQKMIMYSNYEKIIDELDIRNKRIEYLEQKVTHLENLLEVKLERINDLMKQLERVSIQRNVDSTITLDQQSVTSGGMNIEYYDRYDAELPLSAS